MNPRRVNVSLRTAEQRHLGRVSSISSQFLGEGAVGSLSKSALHILAQLKGGRIAYS